MLSFQARTTYARNVSGLCSIWVNFGAIGFDEIGEYCQFSLYEFSLDEFSLDEFSLDEFLGNRQCHGTSLKNYEP